MSFGCWESNADVKAWMAKHAMGTNLTLLNNYYMSNLLKIIKGTMNKTAMFWRPGAADSLPQTADAEIDYLAFMNAFEVVDTTHFEGEGRLEA